MYRPVEGVRRIGPTTWAWECPTCGAKYAPRRYDPVGRALVTTHYLAHRQAVHPEPPKRRGRPPKQKT